MTKEEKAEARRCSKLFVPGHGDAEHLARLLNQALDALDAAENERDEATKACEEMARRCFDAESKLSPAGTPPIFGEGAAMMTLVVSERDSLKAKLAEAVEFVRMAGEHLSGYQDDVTYCLVCGARGWPGVDMREHMGNCRLALWLKSVEGYGAR